MIERDYRWSISNELAQRTGHEVMRFDEAGNDLGPCALLAIDHRNDAYVIENCTCRVLKLLNERDHNRLLNWLPIS